MGMFDYIKTEMPLPPDPRDPDVEWYQTKDTPTLQLWMDKWLIRADGRLIKLGYRIEDRSDKTAPLGHIDRLAGCMTSVYDSALDKIIDFHGDIGFGHYDSKTREDWDYIARFTDGICTKIWCDEYHPPNPTS